ncbi:MAG: tRNA-dihydrouridine synthase family protein [Planctomycetes bacterium]|nr:tRNA-dihydrouridine synthase family protein [Planctomycetota bacterium]
MPTPRLPDPLPDVILAPLTKGGNLPFRRLCVEFGASITMSEMAYARQVVRGSRTERALLRKHASETCFGVQIAASKPEDAVAAGKIAVENGARFVDLNCGCPIHDVVRRGMGATLLQRPAALQRIVAAMVTGLGVPVTVKLRSGWKEDEINAPEIARLCEDAGAAAITLHARTREQRYTKSADWGLVKRLVEERGIPVVGNGDVLTWHEARDRRAESGCASVMLGRGVLIKPWLFKELVEKKTWLPTAQERVEVYARFVAHCREHFGADEKGKKKASFFLPWHFGFFCRWRPMPEAMFEERAKSYPLMQTRVDTDGELPPLERILRDPREDVHRSIAGIFWEASDAAAACAALESLAEATPAPIDGEAGEIAVAHG